VNETWLQVSQYDSETGQWVHHIKDIGGYVTISPNIGYWVKIE